MQYSICYVGINTNITNSVAETLVTNSCLGSWLKFIASLNVKNYLFEKYARSFPQEFSKMKMSLMSKET